MIAPDDAISQGELSLGWHAIRKAYRRPTKQRRVEDKPLKQCAPTKAVGGGRQCKRAYMCLVPNLHHPPFTITIDFVLGVTDLLQ